MKVAHALGWYFPESVGGTEVYVETLCGALAARGVESVVVAPSASGEEWETVHRGVPVYFYSATASDGGGARMAKWIQAQRVDLYHQHSWTSGCGVAHLRAARGLALRTVFTVHVPSPICLRGTMMLHGREACDGKIDEIRCGVCWGRSRRMPRWLAELVSRIPLTLGSLARQRLPNSMATTALSWRARVAGHASDLHQLRVLSDRVVAVSGWLIEALLRNGFSREQLFLCRHGIDPTALESLGKSDRGGEGAFVVGFLGRWDPVKGLHVLVRAIRNLPESVPVKLVVHATGKGETEDRYRREMIDLVAGDPRVTLGEAVPREAVLRTLAGFDLLAVPSQWLETGPYVVLEAQAAGTPVLGSNLGGIRELVRVGVNGWLVPHADPAAWSRAIERLAGRERRTPEVALPVRQTAEVAREMEELYRDVLSGEPALSISSSPTRCRKSSLWANK